MNDSIKEVLFEMSVDVTAKTKLLGVLGTPIEHSSSPKIHNTAFEALGLDYEYLAFDVGPETLGAFVLNRPVIGELLGGIIGFIPNCAASVVLTTLYLEGAMSGGAMLSGLLVGSGVGLLVLLRMNRDWRDNLVTAGLLYAGGVIFGLLADVLHIV